MQRYLIMALLLIFPFRTLLAQNSKPVYVLVHGAWHGGWCWQEVSRKLRAQGYEVYTPSMSGMSEYKHTRTPQTNLSTHITDIISLLIQEDLHHVVLVGHSYAGAVITGVADSIPERLEKLIYLDALLPHNGQNIVSLQEPAQQQRLNGLIKQGITTIPIMTADLFGVTDPARLKWTNERLTLQPIRTFTEPLRLKHVYGNNIPLVYIGCTQPQLPVMQQFIDAVKKDRAWKYYGLKTGHDAMITAPEELTKLLVEL
ncbi:alpha/beta hydrolase [Chitinophaga sp. Mgbs1]|uniref:Alpha/beta hydrolase n=1 Tax=Chitinophaga solisilvae TaxID=1233460 RepID=A0A433WK12_9BACT|nr:alpha/beta hydrolase [Chitinophaga solisilvae]